MKKKILAVIPCRSGSKSIKNKNILSLFGRPLIYYSIFFAKKCNFIDKIIISTDSKRYLKIANSFGVNTKYLRPKKISKDYSLDLDLFKDVLNYLNKKENFIPDYVVHLRPTSPLRKINDLKKMLKILINKKADSVRSISTLKDNPYKSWTVSKDGFLKPILKNKTNFVEPYNYPRQKLPLFYKQNGVYDIFRSKLLKKNYISGKKIFGYETSDFQDIDSLSDLYSIKKFKKFFLNFEKYINRK